MYTDRVGNVDVDAFSVQKFKYFDLICSSSNVDCRVSILQSTAFTRGQVSLPDQ